MITIEEFIEARLAEDEAIAKWAGDGIRSHWAYAGPNDRYTRGEVYLPDTKRTIRNYVEYERVTNDHEGLCPSVDEDEATHIARHDPARVVGQCAALREILAEHDNDESYCSRCWDGDTYAPSSHPYPCRTLRSLAKIWADHPDYRADWHRIEGASA